MSSSSLVEMLDSQGNIPPVLHHHDPAASSSSEEDVHVPGSPLDEARRAAVQRPPPITIVPELTTTCAPRSPGVSNNGATHSNGTPFTPLRRVLSLANAGSTTARGRREWVKARLTIDPASMTWDCEEESGHDANDGQAHGLRHVASGSFMRSVDGRALRMHVATHEYEIIGSSFSSADDAAVDAAAAPSASALPNCCASSPITLIVRPGDNFDIDVGRLRDPSTIPALFSRLKLFSAKCLRD